jgi:hypothetical protein
MRYQLVAREPKTYVLIFEKVDPESSVALIKLAP